MSGPDVPALDHLSPVLPVPPGPDLDQPLSRISSSIPAPRPPSPWSPHRSLFRTHRKLLLVYIHGFYGNDQSFRSFPAHVHALVRTLLCESHVIHSKIYPRYKTYHSIELVRDNFSSWREPHESPTTDVILLGHSMGGLLAADVVLMVRRCSLSTGQ